MLLGRLRGTLMWLLIGMATACSDGGTPPEVILINGRFWTGANPAAAPTAGPAAVAIRNGRVIAMGSVAEIEQLGARDTRVLDLGGRRVVPGFIDNHTHFVDGGFELAGVQLRDAATPGEFARRIGARSIEHPGEWVLGGTWDHELWGGELPHRAWIDSLTGDTPVFVTRLDGHMSLANSRALRLGNVRDDTPDPVGGTIVRDDRGRATGVLKDAAQSLVFDAIPERTDQERDRALQAALRHALERGVTMVTDMGSWAGLEAYRRAHRGGGLPLRVYNVVPLATWERLADLIDREGWGDHRLMWGGVKGFVDGSLGSTTAWFYDPYSDAPETRGLVMMAGREVEDAIVAADSALLHVMIHAIGDRANDWLLDVFARAVAENPVRGRRFRIEHAQHLRPESIRRIADEDIVASMQPYHAIDDGRWAEKRIGPTRILTTYAFRDLLDAGAHLTFGSDWTVAPIDPILGIYAAVTRRTIDGAHPGGWVPSQRITVAEAVRAYTSENAYASYLEEELGTIEPGKYADMVVLSDDIFTIDPVDIEAVQVDMTIVNGEVVFER